jgi:Tfp pilus assembly protein PilO
MYSTINRFLTDDPVPFFAVSIALLITILIARSWLVPQYYRFENKKITVDHYRDLVSDKGNYANIKSRITDNQTALEESISSLSAGFIDARDLSGLLNMLIQKAKQSDIQFVKMQPHQESVSADFIRYPVLLDMTTTYHSLGNFIAELERTPHMVRIERIAITSTSVNAIAAKVLLTCYLQRQAGVQ